MIAFRKLKISLSRPPHLMSMSFLYLSLVARVIVNLIPNGQGQQTNDEDHDIHVNG